MSKNNTIIVTGSSDGIGAKIAQKWCKLDNKNFYYGISRYSDLDITNHEVINEYINDIFLDDRQRTKALVNNAGVIVPGSILETKMHDVKYQFDVNVFGLFNASKAYIKNCINYKVPGKIINIASTAGMGDRPGRATYASTKAAVINLSLSMAEELREYNIKVYCVCPPAVNTKMRVRINPDDNFEDMMQPQEVANFVCDLIQNGDHLDAQALKLTKK